MGFPKILHCFICEDLRVERGNKATILGFYGLTPQVSIGVLEPEKALERLMFVLVAEKSREPMNAKVHLRILNENGTEEQRLPALQVSFPKSEKTTTIGIGVYGYVFHKPGKRTLQLYAEDKMHFETTFEVLQGSLEDLG